MRLLRIVIISMLLLACVTLHHTWSGERVYNYGKYFANQPYLQQIGMPSQLKLPETGLIVAVIDIGMDLSHPAYKNKLIENDFRGESAIYPEDEACLAHGTAVASLIAAESREMIGIAPNVKLLPVCIGVPNPKGYEDIATTYYKMGPKDFIKLAHDPDKLKRLKEFAEARKKIILKNCANAIRYAVDHGAKVINMSFTTLQDTQYIADAVRYAASRGVVLVAGTGNSGNEGIGYPAKFKEVIAVGGVDENDVWWYEEKQLEGIPIPIRQGSNYGEGIDVVAPCCNLLHAFPTQLSDTIYQTTGCGTSLATPLVTGLAALILSLNPTLSVEEVKQLIIMGCDDLDDTGWDKKYGYGRINVGKTLTLMKK